MSYYYAHMQALEKENIAAYKYLESSGFSGSLTGKPHSFQSFWSSDQGDN